MTDFEFLAETFKPLCKNNEKILLPAEGLNFEKTIEENRYLDSEPNRDNFDPKNYN